MGPKTTTLQARLAQMANEHFLHDGARNGPSLTYGGTDIVACKFGRRMR
jgi:hypothetical protein